MANLLLAVSGDGAPQAPTPFDLACLEYCLDGGGAAVVVGRPAAPGDGDGCGALDLPPSLRGRVTTVAHGDDRDVRSRVDAVLRDRPGPFVFLQSGAATGGRDVLEEWLPRALAMAGDRVVSPPLLDPVAGLTLYGHSLVLPEMYAVWNAGAPVTRPEGLALPFLVAAGAGKQVLPDALWGNWPYSYCALRLSLQAWRRGVELRCEPGAALEIAPPPPDYAGLERPSLQFAAVHERLHAWRALWGYETMLIEGMRLASVLPHEVRLVLDRADAGSDDVDWEAAGTPSDLARTIAASREAAGAEEGADAAAGS